MKGKIFALSSFRRRFGLTLVELLIVCAIIVVLVGIVFLVTEPARERARLTVCINNLKQIGLAYQLYRQDWDGIDPEPGRRLQWWELGLPKAGAVGLFDLGYIKDERILLCPNWTKYFDTKGPKLLSSYAILYAPDEDTSIPELRPFSWVIADMPNFPIQACYLHDPEFLARNLRRADRVLGLTVTGEVGWYSWAVLNKYRYK
ncbi:MAG: hypothetical protein C4295_10675 [Candidatus Fervidibacterota bacterium]